MSKKFIFGIIALIILITSVSAIPVTNAVTDITSGKVTFNAAGGAAGAAWFEWGSKTGGPYIWTTPNQTIGAGAFTDYQYGPPMLTGTTYYVRACDTTGCGAQVAFAVPGATPINQTHFGTDAVQIMRGGFNITKTALYITKPFAAPYPSPYANAIPYGFIFFVIFSGIWIRQRDMLIPMMISMCSGGLIWLGADALGIPPEFVMLGQMMLVIGIAGTLYSFFSK